MATATTMTEATTLNISRTHLDASASAEDTVQLSTRTSLARVENDQDGGEHTEPQSSHASQSTQGQPIASQDLPTSHDTTRTLQSPADSLLPPQRRALASVDELDGDQMKFETHPQQEQEVSSEAVTPINSQPLASSSSLLKQDPEEPAVPQMPQTYLTFLLISGRRKTMSFEPETTVGRVKELVWNAWPAEWQDERPPAPSYLRVLYLGKMLQDDETLMNLKIPTHTPSAASTPTPTIVHLSIRPYALASDGDALKKKKRGNREGANPANPNGGGEDRAAGCCGGCIIC